MKDRTRRRSSSDITNEKYLTGYWKSKTTDELQIGSEGCLDDLPRMKGREYRRSFSDSSKERNVVYVESNPKLKSRKCSDLMFQINQGNFFSIGSKVDKSLRKAGIIQTNSETPNEIIIYENIERDSHPSDFDIEDVIKLGNIEADIHEKYYAGSSKTRCQPDNKDHTNDMNFEFKYEKSTIEFSPMDDLNPSCNIVISYQENSCKSETSYNVDIELTNKVDVEPKIGIPPPMYKSLIQRILEDPPPKYEDVTGKRLNVNENYSEKKETGSRNRRHANTRSCKCLKTWMKITLAILLVLGIILVCVLK